MKFKAAFKFLLLFTLMVLLNPTFVRAGLQETWVDSGNHMYTIILVLAVVALAVIFGGIPLLTKLKSRSAAKVMTHASNKDTFWNTEELKKHAEKAFYEIQDAWENRNMDKVKDKVDKELYVHYKTLLTEMLNRREKNILTQIHIDETRIIGCEDYIDNSKDRYIGYIQGRLLDYLINEDTQEITKNSSKTLSNFSVSYHFVRNDNSWILEKIDTDVTMQDLIQTKNSFEA
ncbi:TIM44-like domain-containing protein [Cytophaga aurantiaca]|uniref:TIM44-like domain-containing protein n=1 Tax=Cytophaga aurantiaca TaxID=29530 RepID=UPI00037EFBB9|nr:TIM44-like domain-containing protein [Cytophaga aurantiaca]